jgi:hypothetical protein
MMRRSTAGDETGDSISLGFCSTSGVAFLVDGSFDFGRFVVADMPSAEV